MTAARNAKEPEQPRFQVLRSFNGLEPGSVVEPDATWPFHRIAQLVRQRYLLPLTQDANAHKPVRA